MWGVHPEILRALTQKSILFPVLFMPFRRKLSKTIFNSCPPPAPACAYWGETPQLWRLWQEVLLDQVKTIFKMTLFKIINNNDVDQ